MLSLRRAIGTTPQLAQKLVFCNSDLTNRSPFVRWNLKVSPKTFLDLENQYDLSRSEFQNTSFCASCGVVPIALCSRQWCVVHCQGIWMPSLGHQSGRHLDKSAGHRICILLGRFSEGKERGTIQSSSHLRLRNGDGCTLLPHISLMLSF